MLLNPTFSMRALSSVWPLHHNRARLTKQNAIVLCGDQVSRLESEKRNGVRLNCPKRSGLLPCSVAPIENRGSGQRRDMQIECCDIWWVGLITMSMHTVITSRTIAMECHTHTCMDPNCLIGAPSMYNFSVESLPPPLFLLAAWLAKQFQSVILGEPE